MNEKYTTPSTPFSVRQFEARDREAVMALWPADVLQSQPDAQTLNMLVNSMEDASAGKQQVWVAEASDRIIGSAAVISDSATLAHLKYLFVAPEFVEDHIVARGLAKTAITYTRERGYLKLVVHTNLPPCRLTTFLRELGFEFSREHLLDKEHVLDFYQNLYARPRSSLSQKAMDYAGTCEDDAKPGELPQEMFDVNAQNIEIKTKDGLAPCHFFTPPRTGSRPAVIFYMDAIGIRPALFDMAQRLASSGYYVLLPNLYYRSGPIKPFDAATIFKEGPERDRMMPLVRSLNHKLVMEDTASFLDFLQQQPTIAGQKIGCVGYCMGGGFALSAAGTFPDRIAAAASLHGGRLATDQPDSPHLLAPKMRAEAFTWASPASILISRRRKSSGSNPPSNPQA